MKLEEMLRGNFNYLLTCLSVVITSRQDPKTWMKPKTWSIIVRDNEIICVWAKHKLSKDKELVKIKTDNIKAGFKSDEWEVLGRKFLKNATGKTIESVREEVLFPLASTGE